MVKKILKRVGITLLVLLILLIATPYLFQSQIKDMVKNFINDNINAKVEFTDVDLSLLKSFPDATIIIDDLSVVNYAPFENDTLVSAKSIALELSIKELFKTKSDEPIAINAIAIDNILINIISNEDGQANYDIAKPSAANESNNESSSGFTFSLEDYKITNSAISYLDESSKMYFSLTEFNHYGNGVFSEEQSELNTKTTSQISLSIDSAQYLNNNNIKLDAIIGMNLKESIYTFKDNKAFINKLPLEFDGFLQLIEEGQKMDITFTNPESSFKDFLALVPQQYAANLTSVETSGDFKVNGKIKGELTKTTIPSFDINISSNNASFKFPDLPKSVKNIVIDTNIKNTSGNIDDSFVAINDLQFKIDQDTFKASATIKDLTKNIFVGAHIDGTLNLANITKAYPIELENALSGTLKGKLDTSFDMNAIETNAYERIKNDGTVNISDFVFSSKDIVNPLNISNANIDFKTESIKLTAFNATSGTSDIEATGTLENLLGFLLSNKTLQGNFNVNSNRFAVSDFMIEGESSDTETNSESQILKIPAFLDCTINANANTVLYDNLTLNNVKGTLILKDEKAEFKGLKSDIFDGQITMDGIVNTQNEVPTFNVDLDASDLDISKSFSDLKLFKALVPVANALKGKLNSNINLSGSLDEAYTPNLSTVSGNALAELLTTKIEPKNTELFNKLDQELGFIDLSKLNLKDIKTHLSFENGQVAVKPFDIKYKDINITVSGSHGFDKSINYSTVFDVPAKYLGNEITSLLSQIDANEAQRITVPVTANIGGVLTKPTITTDLSKSVTNLTNQLIEIKKKQLLNQGGNLLNDILNNNTKSNDSTKTNSNTGEVLNNVLGNIFSKKKKKKDSIKN
ncbi:AsmA-like C-terminal region-containing protein [Pontimicrobium sp. IMCC45349]|uniref:AsmA-like C-terminal region-containing protein n=1 Tax=Pontimicrobium sp. IMCC45349 TaxID=3391574 RepID=UPI0039A202B5